MFVMSEEMMYDEFVFFARWLVPSVDRYKATNYSELIIWSETGEMWIYDGLSKSTLFLHRPYDKGNDEEARIKREFSLCLKRIMKFNGITQKELSVMIGCTQAAISYYCRGDRLPTIVVMRQLARALNCSVNDLTYTYNLGGE